MSGVGFPVGASGKESTCQCRRHKKRGFDLWVRKIPWRGKWQATPVFLPRNFHGQRSLAMRSQRVKESVAKVGHDWMSTLQITVTMGTLKDTQIHRILNKHLEDKASWWSRKTLELHRGLIKVTLPPVTGVTHLSFWALLSYKSRIIL